MTPGPFLGILTGSLCICRCSKKKLPTHLPSRQQGQCHLQDPSLSLFRLPQQSTNSLGHFNNRIYFLTVPEAGRPRSRCLQGWFLPKRPLLGLWISSLFLVSSHGHSFVCLCVQIPSLLIRMSVMLNPIRPYLSSINLWKKTHLQIQSCSEVPTAGTLIYE